MIDGKINKKLIKKLQNFEKRQHFFNVNIQLLQE